MQGIESIKAFQAALDLIYGEQNRKKDFEYLYSYLFRNSSYLSRSILRGGATETFFMRTFSWLFALANHQEVDLETAFRRKFPLVCPYCIASPCCCSETHKTPARAIPAHAVSDELNDRYNTDYNSNHSLAINSAVDRIGSLYPSNKAIWHAFGSFYHFSRLHEEIGEVHEAYTALKKGKSKRQLEEELADVTAWLFSAWQIHTNGASLKDAILNYYVDGCPVCNAATCNCSSYSDRSQAVPDQATLSEIKATLEAISTNMPGEKEAIEELLRSLESAIRSASSVDARSSINKTEIFLDRASKYTNQAAGIAKNAETFGKSLSALGAMIERFTG
ncbi:hypothetical protein LQF05_07825 [Stutzerimonas stutzeri]|uniref:hypothetical protein n=1 Tax=Stutzerimonas stutzeri TaxID=316 RepID=UPI0022DE68AE|nr:hypothetical protein [Stutzerimonas stutzeri]WBL61806.1 hypothetical protein LQF05_07825 [Stutzerimonas stutzeri]